MPKRSALALSGVTRGSTLHMYTILRMEPSCHRDNHRQIWKNKVPFTCLKAFELGRNVQNTEAGADLSRNAPPLHPLRLRTLQACSASACTKPRHGFTWYVATNDRSLQPCTIVSTIWPPMCCANACTASMSRNILWGYRVRILDIDYCTSPRNYNTPMRATSGVPHRNQSSQASPLR